MRSLIAFLEKTLHWLLGSVKILREAIEIIGEIKNFIPMYRSRGKFCEIPPGWNLEPCTKSILLLDAKSKIFFKFLTSS